MNNWQIAGLIALGTIVLLIVGIRLLLRGRRVPNKAKFAVVAAVVWLLSPVDLLPDFLGPLGLLDDFGVVVAVLKYVMDQVGRSEPLEQRLGRRNTIDVSDWRLRDDDGPRELP